MKEVVESIRTGRAPIPVGEIPIVNDEPRSVPIPLSPVVSIDVENIVDDSDESDDDSIDEQIKELADVPLLDARLFRLGGTPIPQRVHPETLKGSFLKMLTLDESATPGLARVNLQPSTKAAPRRYTDAFRWYLEGRRDGFCFVEERGSTCRR